MSSDIYAGPVAKAAAFAQTTGADASDFGGVDLIARLSKRVAQQGADRRPAPGQGCRRLRQRHRPGLRRPGADRRAVEEGRQGHRPSCSRSSARAATSGSTSPRTRPRRTRPATAASARRPAPRTPTRPRSHCWPCSEGPSRAATIDNAIDGAVSWLLKTQANNGSFGGGTSTEAPNANSTGLAASALASARRVRPRPTRPCRWLGKLTVTDVLRRERRHRLRQGRARDGAEDGISDDGARPVRPGHRPGGAGAALRWSSTPVTERSCAPARPRRRGPRDRGGGRSSAGLTAPARAATCADSGGVSVVVDFKEPRRRCAVRLRRRRWRAEGRGPLHRQRVRAHVRPAHPGLRLPGPRRCRPATRASTPRPPTPTGGCGGPTARPGSGPTPR